MTAFEIVACCVGLFLLGYFIDRSAGKLWFDMLFSHLGPHTKIAILRAASGRGTLSAEDLEKAIATDKTWEGMRNK